MGKSAGYLIHVDQDFSETLVLLQSRTMAQTSLTQPEVKKLRSLHHAIYSLCIWDHFVKVDDNGQVFLGEIASDAMQITPHVLCGFRRSSMLLARSIIENTLRHIYFTDHPVEFERANRDSKFYLSAEQLFDYCRNYVHFLYCEERFQALSKLRSLYSTLSAAVHGARVADLSLHAALKSITFDPSSLDGQVKHVVSVAKSCNFLMWTGGSSSAVLLSSLAARIDCSLPYSALASASTGRWDRHFPISEQILITLASWHGFTAHHLRPSHLQLRQSCQWRVFRDTVGRPPVMCSLKPT